MNCSKCEEVLVEEDNISCTLCGTKLHFGCAGFSESNFRKLSKIKKESWKCITCKNKKDVTFTIPSSDSTLMQQFNQLAKDLKGTIVGLEQSVQHNSDTMDEILNGFREMKINFGLMQTKQEELLKENAILKKTVDDLQHHVFEVEQKALDHNVEIVGVPETMEADRVVPAMCGVLSITTPEASQYTAQRARVGAPGRIKPVFVQFESKRLRDEFLKATKRCKPKASQLTNNSSDINPIYVNEELTPHYKMLFYNANKLRREKQFKYLWVGEGKILLKKSDTSKTIRVRNLEDVN